MGHIVEVGEEGTLVLDAEAIQGARPHTRYEVEVEGKTLVLRPVDELPFWATATPAERAGALREWANRKRPPAPPLPDDALRRESMYD